MYERFKASRHSFINKLRQRIGQGKRTAERFDEQSIEEEKVPMLPKDVPTRQKRRETHPLQRL